MEQGMERIRLIHWNAEEAREKARGIEALGYSVEAGPLDGPAGLRLLFSRRRVSR